MSKRVAVSVNVSVYKDFRILFFPIFLPSSFLPSFARRDILMKNLYSDPFPKVFIFFSQYFFLVKIYDDEIRIPSLAMDFRTSG
jgi:hypothetical protein